MAAIAAAAMPAAVAIPAVIAAGDIAAAAITASATEAAATATAATMAAAATVPPTTGTLGAAVHAADVGTPLAASSTVEGAVAVEGLQPAQQAAVGGVSSRVSDFEWVISGRKSGSFQKRLVRRPMIISADGGQKFTHYAKCGVQHTAVWNSMTIKPMHARYFTPKLDRAYLKYSAYSKDLLKTKADATAAARAASVTTLADDLAAENEVICQADLLAARSTAPNSKSAHTDVKVVLGAVCSHVVRSMEQGSFQNPRSSDEFET